MASTATASESYHSTLPLTPCDSDNEQPPSEAGAMAGRKRSASEMEDEKRATKQSDRPSKVPETIEAEMPPDFILECPARPKTTKQLANDDIYIERDAPSLAPHLTIDFAVRPGKKWSELSRFKNAKFNNPVVVIYTSGQVVYVNRQFPIPESPPADATEDERLQYDKENFWVGLISEFRAESPEKVYVKVFWLYWPDELPEGRQPYHGKRELVLSNHVDIIDASTIATHAEISYWDENDDSNKNVLQERYWRQTYDLKKAVRDPRNALSRLRRFCICGKYDNPNVEMYQCHKPQVGCGLWNHQECLLKDLEERAWNSFLTGTLTHEREEDKTLGQKVEKTVGGLIKPLVALAGVGVDDKTVEVSVTPKGGKRQKQPNKGQKAWFGKLKANIETVDGNIHNATVTQLVPTPASAISNGKGGHRFEPKEWRMKLNCLKCGESLN